MVYSNCSTFKLFRKKQTFPILSNLRLYCLSSVFRLGVSLVICVVFPLIYNLVSFNLYLIYIFCLLILRVYRVIMAGRSSNRNYSLLESLRSLANTISYKVRLVISFIRFIIFTQRYEEGFETYNLFLDIKIFLFSDIYKDYI